MPSPILPKALSPGDTIAFVSPSARMNHTHPAVISRAASIFTSRGYKVRELYTRDTGIQSSITHRLSELRTAFTDASIAAVVCTIGGPAFTELLPALIADTALHAAIRAQPKVVVGYSDITGLHWFLHALTGLRSFYGPGPIPELGDVPGSRPLEFCVQQLFRAIEMPPASASAAGLPQPLGDVARSPVYAPAEPPFLTGDDPASVEMAKVVPTTGWRWLRAGKGRGRLFGGCLTVMARLGAVPAIVPDWRGRVVFLETANGEVEGTGNPIYRVQAGIADLIAQGVFEEAEGLVVGRPLGYNTPEQVEEYCAVITGLLCEGRLAHRTFPILFNVDIGHTTPIVTLPYDAMAVLDSEKDQFSIVESGVI